MDKKKNYGGASHWFTASYVASVIWLWKTIIMFSQKSHTEIYLQVRLIFAFCLFCISCLNLDFHLILSHCYIIADNHTHVKDPRQATEGSFWGDAAHLFWGKNLQYLGAGSCIDEDKTFMCNKCKVFFSFFSVFLWVKLTF